MKLHVDVFVSRMQSVFVVLLLRSSTNLRWVIMFSLYTFVRCVADVRPPFRRNIKYLIETIVATFLGREKEFFFSRVSVS